MRRPDRSRCGREAPLLTSNGALQVGLARGTRGLSNRGRTGRVAGPGAAVDLTVSAALSARVGAGALDRGDCPRNGPGPGDEAQREEPAEREAARHHTSRLARLASQSMFLTAFTTRHVPHK
jgi:hypothetical protein